MTLKVLEAQTQWANQAELYIGLIKEATRKDLQAYGLPSLLWDYCMEHQALIYQVTAKNLFQLNGTTLHTFTFGTDADISKIFVILVGMSGYIFVRTWLLFFF